MTRYRVTVDDPHMGCAHVFDVTVDAPFGNPEGAARLVGARCAIRCDRLGAGIGFPEGTDAATYVMPLDLREAQADNPALLESVVMWTHAERVDDA